MNSDEGLRILLVEDEAILAFWFEDLLASLGCHVVRPVADIAEAVRMAQSERLAGAFLDVNIGGATIYPVADVLSAREIPFVFVSGYGATGIDPRYVTASVLTKPVFEAQVESALNSMRQHSRRG